MIDSCAAATIEGRNRGRVRSAGGVLFIDNSIVLYNRTIPGDHYTGLPLSCTLNQGRMSNTTHERAL